jgi:hypothetical protein
MGTENEVAMAQKDTIGSRLGWTRYSSESNSVAMFTNSVISILGDSSRTLFWSDK